MDIQERLTAFAMLGAEWVMWLLVLLSIFSLAIMLERAFFFFATRENVDALKRDLMKKLKAGEVEAAMRSLENLRSFEARIVLSGLSAAEDGAASAEEKMAGEAGLAKLAMERFLAFLGTVGNNAPFIGLLGTVIGVIGAFEELRRSGSQVSEGLMGEIGEALVATAIGLLVALPAVAFYNIFTRTIKARLARGDSLGREVLAFLKSKRFSAAGVSRDGSHEALDEEGEDDADESAED